MVVVVVVDNWIIVAFSSGLADRYHCGKFRWNGCSNFDNMQVLVICQFGLKTPIHAAKIWVLGDLILYTGSYLVATPNVN